MRGDVSGLGLLAFAAVLGGMGLHGAPAVPEARADEPAQIAVSGPSCKLKGTGPLSKGARLYDSVVGGRAIATFTGALVPMTVSGIPVDPSVGRARLSTSNGSPALRLDGFLGTSDLTVFAGRDLPVVAGHVWISSGQKVKVVGATADSLRAELSIGGTLGQVAKTTAPCETFTLQRSTPAKMDIPGNARGYLSKSTALDLFDGPNGNVIFSLKMMEGTAQLFWSTEAKNGFVQLVSRGDITIDAWARLRDLQPLKKGEMMDQYIPPTTAVAGAMLALDKAPPIVKASKSTPVRARRDDKERPIGELEAGAEVYLLETVAGWTNVLPKALGMTPPDEGGFWIPGADAPK